MHSDNCRINVTLALYFLQVLMYYINGGKFRQKLSDMLHVCMAIVLDQI